MSTVSVIIVNWNGRRHLEICLPALYTQTRPADEIIVVDNGSSDDSVAFVREHYPEVKLVETGENLGFSGGNIAGYAVATGAYIVLLNNDTKPLSDWLEALVKSADARGDVGVVASLMTDWEGRVVDTAGDGCSVTGRGYHLHKLEPVPATLASKLASKDVFSACAGAALYKREMLQEIGFLDPRFFMNAEDTDLSFRAQLGGWKVHFCAQSVVRHRISASQGAASGRSVFFNARNHLWCYLKCMPLPLIVLYSPVLLVETLALWMLYLTQGNGTAYARGLVAAVRGAREVLEERKRVQAGRKLSVRALHKKLSWPRLIEAGLGRVKASSQFSSNSRR